MTLRHRVPASSPRSFGRRSVAAPAVACDGPADAAISDELRLFALTFAGGFLFMSVFLA